MPAGLRPVPTWADPSLTHDYQTSEPDLGHPLCPQYAWLFEGRARLPELVGRGPIAVAQSGTLNLMPQEGMGRRFGRGAQFTYTGNIGAGIDLGPDADLLPTDGKLSILLAKWKTDTTAHDAVDFGVISPVEPGSFAQRCGADVPYSDGQVHWDYGGVVEGTTRLSVGSLTYGDDVWLFTVGARGMEIWQNGILRASNAGTPTRSGSGGRFYLADGQRNASGVVADSAVYSFLQLFHRQLTVNECVDVQLNPLQWVRSARRRAVTRFTPPPTDRVVIPNSIASTGNTSVSSKAVTLPFAVKAGSLIVVSGAAWRATTPLPITVTDTLGTTYTVKAGTALADGSGLSAGFLAYGYAPSRGTPTITVTPVGGTTFLAFSAHEVTDVTALDVDGGESTGTSGTSSDGITTTVADTVIFALHHAAQTSTDFVPGSGITQLAEYQSADNSPYALMWRRAATAGAYTMDATHGTRNWSVLTLAFRGNGTTPPSPPQSAFSQVDNVASTTLPIQQPVLAGQYIVVSGAIWRVSDPHTIAITDNLGHTYTVVESGAIPWSGGFSRGWIAYAKVVTPGTVTVTVTPSGSGSYINAYAMVANHVDAASPINVGPNEATGTGTAVTVGLTPTVDNTLAVAMVTSATPASVTTITEGNGYVPVFEDEQNARNAVQVAVRQVAVAGSAAPTFTLGTSREWRVLGLALTPATLPAAPPTPGTVVTVGDTGTNTPTTVSFTTAAGETYLVVRVGMMGVSLGNVASVTFGATSLTSRIIAAGSGIRTEIWTGVVPASTTATVTVTYGGGSNANACVAVEAYQDVAAIGTGQQVVTPSASVSTLTFDGITMSWTGLNHGNRDTAHAGLPLISSSGVTLLIDAITTHFGDNNPTIAAGQTAEFTRFQDGASQTELDASRKAAAVTSAGTLTKTLDAATVSAAGTVAAAPATGTLTKTLDALAATALGTVSNPRTGTLTKTLDAMTLIAAATTAAGRFGTLSVGLGAVALSAAGTAATPLPYRPDLSLRPLKPLLHGVSYE